MTVSLERSTVHFMLESLTASPVQSGQAPNLGLMPQTPPGKLAVLLTGARQLL